MPFLSVNGIDYHYRTDGDGPPLLLIAGLASDSASWAPVSGALAKTARLIMPDNRACGQTQANRGEVSLTAFADDCIALLDHLGVKSANVLGHSMGGAIAMELAATRPDRVNRLILCASAPKISARARQAIKSLADLRASEKATADWYRTFFCWLFAPAFFEDARAVDAAVAMAMAYPHRQSAADMRRQIDAMIGVDLTQKLHKIRANTLILAGQYDILFPACDIRNAYGALEDVEISIFENAAHSLHWDQPQVFCERVERFLTSPR
ncbi:MAG: alpha/beta fold hydrolase [Pseudomonadota bacterium]